MSGCEKLSRRDFLKLMGVGAGALITHPQEMQRERGKNLLGHDSLEVLGIEERPGIIRLEETPVVCFPLRDDYFLSSTKPIEVWSLGGVDASFSKIFTLRTPDGGRIKVAPLHHTTGVKTLPLAILAEEATGLSFIDKLREPDIADFSMIGEYYPNKQHNLLESAAQFLRHQLRQGIFRSGTSYSTLSILDIRGDRAYRYGEINGVQIRGAGVCGFATTLSHALSLTETRVDERQAHSYWSTYWVGPLDPEVSLEGDATISSTGGIESDFRWTPSQDFYISIDAAMAIRGPRQTDGLTGNNSRLLLTLSLQRERPNLAEQLSKIERIKEAYDDYNLRGIAPASEVQEGMLMESYAPGEGIFYRDLYRSVRNEEDRSGFEEELANDSLTRDILAVQVLVERYIREYPYEEYWERHEKTLGSYIKESEWYENLDASTKESLNCGLDNIDQQNWRFPTQVTQCVAWVIFLSSLGRANSPLNISGFDINYARDLVPEELRGGGGPRVLRGWTTYVSTERLEDFEPGDLFVTQNVPYDQGAGHVGAIVAKKTIDGKTALLVSDANRGFDGKVRLFKVDETNKYAIFGRPPINWVGMRRANV
ncbi:MAG TPA: twin-arginine translocation signal domain-containing protein [Patescibacteria group bacterium]|uniref:Uncharacterized protein n=1 Tax=Candidatus Woesebacteria bacterium RBG_13_46_13 TaxID=1802479 RepID=A0A1F7X3Y8_9BACT|nr:MAG: hypothetical protein A2Y68_03655 [Candidatus Woesebacteria bacterium RBG_13_46_13]HJX59206.1 twin-arginine translocation signal domain-containing protein [Patescibacteria group bacterium]